MTPLLAGTLASLCAAVGLLAVPMLRDRGPLERFESPGDPAAGNRSFVKALVERLAAGLGPRAMRALNTGRRDRIARRIDLAGRPGA